MTKFLSRSILFQGTDAALAELLDSLGIAPDLRFVGREPETYDHLARGRSAVQGGRIAGDFAYVLEVFLFGITPERLEDILLQASATCAVSLPDERPGAGPFAETLFLDGDRIACDIQQDEGLDETYVHSPAHVRKRLAELRPAGAV